MTHVLFMQVVQVNIGNGIVYSKKHEIKGAVAHMFGTHSAPWFLYEAIRNSRYFTTVCLPAHTRKITVSVRIPAADAALPARMT